MNPKRIVCWSAAALSIAACGPKARDPEPVARARTKATAVATGVKDRTYHSTFPRPDVLAAAQAEAEADPSIDPSGIAAAMDKVRSYAYAPSKDPAPAVDPGRPVSTSFQADARSAVAQVALLQGGEMQVACAFPPCLVRGDFDGDGVPDFAIQVARKADGAGGVGLLLSASPAQVLAAGNPGPLGTNTRWARSWAIEAPAAAQAGMLKGAAARPAGAVLRLTGPKATGAAYLERAAGGGAVQLKAAVISGAVQ